MQDRNCIKVRYWNIKTQKMETLFFICSCTDCQMTKPDEQIPEYYSHEHATDSGWGFSYANRFKDPDTDKDIPAAICPDCMKRLKLKNVSIKSLIPPASVVHPK